MKLSIIIPAYNADAYLPQLLATLDKQMQKGIEVIIVDDGSRIPVQTEYKWAKVIRERNGCPGLTRNVGLDVAKGDYIAFIDADDLVTDDYIALVMEKINEGFDYCYLSWKTLPGGWQCQVLIRDEKDKFPAFNLCVWNRIYKRSLIEGLRFSPKKAWSEDADFIYRLKERGKKAFISKPIYLYRSDTPDSWTKKMMTGRIDYVRIVYNMPEIDANTLKEIKKEYEDKEIVCCTNKYPKELESLAMILPYNTAIKGTELRGDDYNGFTRIERPKRTQVLIWTARTAKIGGIETWIYNFCRNMCKYYDIVVMYDEMDPERIAKLLPYVEVVKRSKRYILCDTLIVNRITDTDPPNVEYQKKIQMAHICKMDRYTVPKDNDITVYASEHCRQTYEDDGGIVINNMTSKKDPCLLLVSAMRTTYEKGMSRMVKLSQLMTAAGISHKWLCFTDSQIRNATPSMIHMSPTLDIECFIRNADYVVQLSDEESFCYTIVEALEAHTAVITTPLGVLSEIGFKDGEHGYIVPYDMTFNAKKLRNVPSFTFKWKNAEIIKQWRSILGDTKPTRSYKPNAMVTVEALTNYFDIVMQRDVRKGELIQCTAQRGQDLSIKNLGRVIE